MNTRFSITRLLVIVVFYLNGAILQSQTIEKFYSISGVVKDKRTEKPVENVNVSAKGTNVGTVTNQDGEFVLKILEHLSVKEIEFSCIGYFNAQVAITKNMAPNQVFYIVPQIIELSQVEVFSWKNPRDLVEIAMEKISDNYSIKPTKLTGFYRETIQKKSIYINISEAVIQVYKTSYMSDVDQDRVQILKGRNLISNRKSDTLDVKFVGGPTIPVFMDIVKNRDILLSQENLNFYSFKMGETITINGKLQFVVIFEPRTISDFPLYYGTLYIDKENYAFTRAEFNVDMSDKEKVTRNMLKDKPLGLRFTPEHITSVVTYRQIENKTYLNYIRNEIKFKCVWKRKLFATNFTILNETVITDIEENNVTRIAPKDAFSTRKALSREAAAYYDEDFWGVYNIIEPTETLENAVNILKKKQK
ncbi:MAG: carboxypeptidase-like regulatory domain-containing protein [Marinilabiliaceae bacterium]|nr:carboxypeptidase-like regulatory domain-containing protein [Marinilabiliaceae bacterium]